MSFEDILLFAVLASFVGLFLLERLFPRRPLPSVRLWTTRGILFFVATFFVTGFLPTLWDPLLGPYQLFDISGWGIGPGIVVGALCLELVNYAWHRALHGNDTLWRWFHQMHHASERMDVPSSMVFSPLDMLGWSAAASFALVFVLGIDPVAAGIVAVGMVGLNIFSHANLRTPRWLGYFIARPEQHALHHERGVHRNNYAIFPIIDWAFGTYRNPDRFDEPSGFFQGGSDRIGSMLVGRDLAPARATKGA